MRVKPDMRISVIIPAYNSGAYIERAINSVLSQTRPSDEIIVVNDGSTDNTSEILKRYGNKIKVIEQSNAGVSAARNAGIGAAAGDWIAFLDADDEYLPEKLRLQSEAVQRNPGLCWVTGNYFFCQCRNNHRRYPALSAEKIEAVRDSLAGKEIFGSYFHAYSLRAAGNTDTMLIRKDKLIEAGLFVQGRTIIEDEDLWLRLAYLGLQMGMVFEPIAVYYIEIESSATQTIRDWVFVDTFLSHHLELTAQRNCFDIASACLGSIFGHWIYKLLWAGQGSAVRGLLKKYGFLLTSYCRFTSHAGSFCTGLWRWNEKRKHPELK
jgi:glycosyltransferase involved in cell wall biosynthesis